MVTSRTLMMNDRPTSKQRSLSLLFAGSFLWLSTQVLADDIEIYVSTNDQEISCAAPNVLFIIDTSGSMNTQVTTQEPWDPDRTYDGCFDPARIYYSESGITPYCDFGTSVAKADVFCHAAASSTEYTGLFQAWDPALERWGKIPDSAEARPIECAADEGLHGDGSNNKNYAVDGDNGPWSDDAAHRIAWGANATSATLFDGNWLNWQQNTPTINRSRLDIVKEVVNNTMDNMTDVNVGLMQFNSSEGGHVIAALTDLNQARPALKETVNSLSPGGSTPLSETLYEAGQYLAGRLVDFGNIGPNRSVAASRIGNSSSSERYLSPLLADGQNNYIVLLTDGVPSNDTSANRKIEALPGYGQLVGESCNDHVDGDCLDKMAQYLNQADLRPDLPGRQNVITHTIGFTINFQLLQNTATRGGGQYFVADDTRTLTRVLSNLARDFSRQASLLTAPTVPVNNFNRSERLNEVYLSLFEPASKSHWPGNLKKYQLLDTGNGVVLAGADGRMALTPDGSFIDSSAVSLWSAPLTDGQNVELGGAASRLLNPDSRNLLTNASGGTALSQVSTGNSAITAAMLGAPDDQRDTVIAWARGFDARDSNNDGNTNDLRLSMGDPIHVQPVTGEYGDDAAHRNGVVFVATNDGYLHAIDTNSGNEIWAFIPQRLLKRLYALSLNEAAQNKQYGLDGNLVLINKPNGKPDTLLFGMRRGGEALFSMDISNRAAPRLNWIIDSSQPDFLEMGQTWSTPAVRKIDIGGRVRTVAIFGGGYDTGQDNREFRLDTKGNAIYIVDVETGERLWSAGNTQNSRGSHDLSLARMNFSIPAGIRVLDQNEDGLADRMYVGDMGGQIWRFDIINGNNPGSLVEGGVLASLGAADSTTSPPPATDVRRFYSTPDVVNVIKDENVFLSINIGSGYRAHPLDTGIHDEFFSIRDFHSAQVIPTGQYGTQALPVITRDDLIDVTGNGEVTLDPSDAGWRLGMVQSDGEKILGESLTADNVLFFNSFTPVNTVQSCLPGAGINRNYRVSVIDGSALTNLDHSADTQTLTPTDRFVEGNIGVPLSAPGFGPNGPGCSGLDCLNGGNEFPPVNGDGNTGTADLVHETYWYPVETP